MRPSISLLGVSSWSFVLRRSCASIFHTRWKADLHSFPAGAGVYLTRMRRRRQLSPANRAKFLLAKSVFVSLRRERREHCGRPDGQVAQPNPGRRKNGIADRGRDDRRAGFAEADWSLDALDELDVELRHVPNAQRRIAVEVRVLHLPVD